MSRYIDADKLIERLMHNPDFLTAPKHSKDGIIDEIVYQPAADVVEVVRCMDCKWARKRDSGKYNCCVDGSLSHDENDYCSYGERREV